jgi:cysteine desulfurase/selenocysteine lyase
MHPAVSNGSYDVARVREDFPILAMQIYGKPLIYLDNAASAQKPASVLDRMMQAYTSEYSNVHRGLHYLANAATEGYETARAKVAAFLNAARTDEIVFTRGATEAINLVAQSFGRAHVQPGDEIVPSIMEHHANIVPWHFLRERQGAVIKWAPIDDDGNFLIDAFEALLTDRTKMVAVTQMSNVLGTITPIKEIVRIAHARGIPVLVDGAQGAVHLDIDVQDLDCDFYAITGHKLYGPTGIGALYGKYEGLCAMPPFNSGGEMIREVHQDNVSYGSPPHRFEAGTPAIVQAIGLGAGIDYINSIGKSRICAHDFATVLDRSGVAVRPGTHCAMPLLERFGVSSTCRASFALYNTFEEIDGLTRALTKAQEFFA